MSQRYCAYCVPFPCIGRLLNGCFLRLFFGNELRLTEEDASELRVLLSCGAVQTNIRILQTESQNPGPKEVHPAVPDREEIVPWHGLWARSYSGLSAIDPGGTVN